MDAECHKDHSNFKNKPNKLQNYNFTCVHQRPENNQVTWISETRRGQENQVTWIPKKNQSHEEEETEHTNYFPY